MTRPAAQGAALAERLQALGHEVVLCPLLSALPLEADLSLEGVTAVIFTSVHGVDGFTRLSGERGKKAYCVGAATAQAARRAGFAEVEAAKGDARDLLRLIEEREQPEEARLLHAGGEHLAFDIAGQLSTVGFSAARAIVYRMVSREALPKDVRTDIGNGGLDAVLFFSPRTAESFVSLYGRAGLGNETKRMTAYCLSGAVAKAAAALPWKTVAIAARPDQESLLALLDAQNQAEES